MPNDKKARAKRKLQGKKAAKKKAKRKTVSKGITNKNQSKQLKELGMYD